MNRKSHTMIVLVDDDPGHLELVRRNLLRAGIENPLVSFECGAAALDFVFARGVHAQRATTPMLVLLDINMPGASGIDVLAQIKSSPKTRTIPVVMLTTTDDPKEVARCYELGCNMYVTKPVDSAQFTETIQRLGLILSVVTLPSSSDDVA